MSHDDVTQMQNQVSVTVSVAINGRDEHHVVFTSESVAMHSYRGLGFIPC